ncbi:hypothetical protein OROMI_017792 [Orobanche minor]
MEAQIIYFISRKGSNEHPHLIRVHQQCPSDNGVRLRESFAWSYKRRYKTGYVWQDLLDDDLVIPISDNEYVLKGSEISFTTNNSDIDSGHVKLEPADNNVIADTIDRTLIANSSIVISNMNKKGNIKTRMAKKVEEISISNNITGVASSDKPRFAMSFRNLIPCGGVETKDSAVVMAHNKQNRPPLFNMCSSYHRDTCKNEKLGVGGPHEDPMILGKARRTYHRWVNSKSCEGLKDSAKREDQCRDEKGACTAYKPLISRPNCSQCGKPFEPEKLHGHMKSCRGMKVMAKASSSCAVSADNKSLKSRKKESASGYFLY